MIPKVKAKLLYFTLVFVLMPMADPRRANTVEEIAEVNRF
jgi:ABC-type transport system involved in cytochrome c biogenesis permease component